MKKFNFKKQILIQDVQLDASVNFQTNGDINVYPCPWESDKVVTNGNRVKYKGGIEVDADGRTRVKRYNVGKNGPGKDNRGRVKIDFSFPKKYPLELMKQLFHEETLEIAAWLMTRKTNTLWTINDSIKREQNDFNRYAERENRRTEFNH